MCCDQIVTFLVGPSSAGGCVAPAHKWHHWAGRAAGEVSGGLEVYTRLNLLKPIEM